MGDVPNSQLIPAGASKALAAEPLPVRNDGLYITDLVVIDISRLKWGDKVRNKVVGHFQERKQFGIKKYGTALQAFNGRKALVDAYQELLDGSLYLRQDLEERRLQGKAEGDVYDAVEDEYYTLLRAVKVISETLDKL